MSLKIKLNKEIRNRNMSITLKELIDKGEVEPFYDLREGRYIGGLTLPLKILFRKSHKTLD